MPAQITYLASLKLQTLGGEQGYACEWSRQPIGDDQSPNWWPQPTFDMLQPIYPDIIAAALAAGNDPHPAVSGQE